MHAIFYYIVFLRSFKCHRRFPFLQNNFAVSRTNTISQCKSHPCWIKMIEKKYIFDYLWTVSYKMSVSFFFFFYFSLISSEMILVKWILITRENWIPSKKQTNEQEKKNVCFCSCCFFYLFACLFIVFVLWYDTRLSYFYLSDNLNEITINWDIKGVLKAKPIFHSSIFLYLLC